MKILIFGLLMIALVGISGCTGNMDRSATDGYQAKGTTVNITSGNMTYPAYLAAPSEEGKKPAIVLVHSINGLEPGYLNLTDKLASEGFVVLSPQWQTFERRPADETVERLLRDSVAYLRTRPDVSGNIGLTGFCIGGRYTMLFLPQIDDFKSGVAFYGFPYSGGPANQSVPADMIGQLKAPMLILHGTHDQGSPVADIYRYATALNASGKYFELKVYQGQPHGFMIENGELSQSFAAKDAYREMAAFFDRTLRE